MSETIKNLKNADLKFEIDNKEIMDFFKEIKYLIMLNEEGKAKTLVLR